MFRNIDQAFKKRKNIFLFLAHPIIECTDMGESDTMEAYSIIILRTVISYILIIVIFRLMGKREIGELSILDLVVFIMIGDIAVVAIEKYKNPFFHIILPIIILLLLQVILSFISLKSSGFRKVLDGNPSIIINNGKIDEKIMRKQRYNFDDLLTQLREQGIIDVNEVRFAILETSGKLSVIKKEENEKMTDSETAYPLIIDGLIQSKSLEQIGQNEFWLRQQLRKYGIEDPKQISLCTYSNGEFYIDKKS